MSKDSGQQKPPAVGSTKKLGSGKNVDGGYVALHLNSSRRSSKQLFDSQKNSAKELIKGVSGSQRSLAGA